MVTLLLAGTATSAPQIDNAALLYYQACLLYEKPDETMANMLSDFCSGKIPPDQAIRDHVEKNRRVIDYAVKAASLANCDWAYDYSQGLDLTLPSLATMRRVTYLLVADAKLLAAQGDYPMAVDRCLSIHRMALHVTDQTLVTYLVGIAISAWANRTIQDILTVAPNDVEMLNQLGTQVSQFQAAFPSVAAAVGQEAQIFAASMRKDQTEKILGVLKDCANSTTGELMATLIRNADDAFFERNRTHWLDSIAAVIDVLESGLPYAETCARLNALDTRLAGEAPDNPDAILTALSLPAVERIYMLATRLQSHFNALQTAIDVYAVKARTGRLPDSLPPDSPLDPFSGKPFGYEKANDHFILRCQEKEEPAKAEANQYEFKIRP